MAKCDVLSLIKKWTSEGNDNITIMGKLKTLLDSGTVTKEDLKPFFEKGQITPDESKKLDTYMVRLKNVKSKGINEILNPDEVKEFVDLLKKARNSFGWANANANFDRVEAAIEIAQKKKPSKVENIEESLERAIIRAKQSGNTTRANQLQATLNNLVKANDLSRRAKIDWKAIAESQQKKEQLLMELGLLKIVLDTGDTETRKKQEKAGAIIIANKKKAKELKKKGFNQVMEEGDDQTADEMAKEAIKISKESKKAREKLKEAESSEFQKVRKAVEKRIKDIQIELQKLDSKSQETFFASTILTALDINPDTYVRSLRELKERQKKSTDNIKYVESIINNAKDDETFTMPFLERLFGKDNLTPQAIRRFFYDTTTEIEEDAASNTPIVKKIKDSLSKEEVKAIFELWKMREKERAFDPAYTFSESKVIEDQMIKGSSTLVYDSDPNDIQPTARSETEAREAKIGYGYDPNSPQDVKKAIEDLHAFLGRLTTLASLPQYGSIAPLWAVQRALGHDAQSLLHLFDDAVVDPLSLDNSAREKSPETVQERMLGASTLLMSLGYTQEDINSMPEFQNVSWVEDMSKIISFDLEWQPNTNNIISASIVVIENGTITRTIEIFNSTNPNEFLSREDAAKVLKTLHEYQNNGYKVFGHNINGRDSDIDQLVLRSGDVKLGFSVALRSFDTMLLGFKGGPSSQFTRQFGPSLVNLSNAFGIPYQKTMSATDAYEVWKSGDLKAYREYVTGDAATAGLLGLAMFKQRGIDTKVVGGRKNSEQTIKILEVTPMWWDQGTPSEGNNQRYVGYHHLFDLTSFSNLREMRGGGFQGESGYEIAQLRAIAVRLVVGLLQTTDPTQIQTILNGLHTADLDTEKNFQIVLNLSRRFHEAYLPILREQRERLYNNQFIITMEPHPEYGTLASTTIDPGKYEEAVIDEIISTIRAYNRNVTRVLSKFAILIGFREPEKNELQEVYIKELFNYASKLFNNKPYSIVDYGNGNFDFVPAVQLGRGFAQIAIGHIEEGLTLTQDIKAPVKAAAATKNDLATQGNTLDPEEEESNIRNREFLRPRFTNVSSFAPLSLYEQERAYHDFALRERMRHILNADITDEMRQKWQEFLQSNKFTEFWNKISTIKEAIKSEKDINKKKELEKEFATLKQEFDAYISKTIDQRLELGRVQRYNLLNLVNNRDIYTRIPTYDEMIEMSLEVALDLPQYIATHVHDSRNRRANDRVYLKGQTYFQNPLLSDGGPIGSTLLPGISSLISWVMSNPVLTEDLVVKSIQNGVEFAKTHPDPFSPTTYWDTSYNGLHHLLILHATYFPQENREGINSIVAFLLGDESGVVNKSDLADFYEKSYLAFEEEGLPHYERKLQESLSSLSEKEKQAKLVQLERLKALQDSEGKVRSEVRDFFKGTVIPVMYKGGKKAVIRDLKLRRDKAKVGDAVRTLKDEDIEVIAEIMVTSGAVTKGRLIDQVLGLKPELANKLAKVLLNEGTITLENQQREFLNLINSSDDLKRQYIGEEAVKQTIDYRINTIVDLLMPPDIRKAPLTAKEEWIAQKKEQIKAKWKARIDKAMDYIDSQGGRIKAQSPESRQLHVILAGGETQFKTQMTLMYLTKMQNAGMKVNDSEAALLEAKVKIGRYIDPDDIMYRDITVFPTLGIGSGTGRAQYVFNYSTNLHGSSLSKGLRLVYKEDGKTLDLKDSVTNSAWELIGNPLAGKDRDAASKEMQDIAIKHYSLMLATDYVPTWLNYDENNESASTFMQTWADRTPVERAYMNRGRYEDFKQYQEAHRQQQLDNNVPADKIKPFSQEDADDAISSNSIPIQHRVGTRVFAPATPFNLNDTVMLIEDAKGLGAFRPRLADYAWEDKVVHGLYEMYRGASKLRETAGSLGTQVRIAKEQRQTPEQILKMDRRTGSQYDIDDLPYIPETESSLLESIIGAKPSIRTKTLQHKFKLDAFAIKYGFEDLMQTKQYARLHQIHRIHQELIKLSGLLGRSTNPTEDELRYRIRHFVLRIWEITKAARDANNTERNLLDFSKSIGIDPSKFRYDDKTNMRWLDALITLGNMGISEAQTLQFGMAPYEFLMSLPTQENGQPLLMDVLKQTGTTTEPFVVQGRDVSALIGEVFADDRVQERATELVKIKEKERGVTYARDETGKFVLLSSIPISDQEEIIRAVLADEKLVMGAVENLNLYIIPETVLGEEKQQSFRMLVLHPRTEGRLIAQRPGVGDPTVLRTVQGMADVKFMLTPEAVKRMLVSARNQALLERIEVAIATNKQIGGPTRLDTLRKENYATFLESRLQQLSEETEILAELQGTERPIRRIGSTKLVDELGMELDLYDSESYFTEQIEGITPFKEAMLADVKVGLTRARQYPALQEETNYLEDFYTNPEKADLRSVVGFALFLKKNGKAFDNDSFKILIEEFIGGVNQDSYIENEVLPTVEKLSAVLDKVNYSPLKGKNKYLSVVKKYLELNQTIEYKKNEIIAQVIGLDALNKLSKEQLEKELKLVTQAFVEANQLVKKSNEKPSRFSSLTGTDLASMAIDPDLYSDILPEGSEINNQIAELEKKGIITEEVAVFYRLFVAQLILKNPNLKSLLSITDVDLGDVRAGEAIKDGDKFKIVLNTRIMKNLGSVDQLRVFTHEISHIARLAFIKDNSREWRQLESLFRSQKGRQAIEVMLLAINNGKKYEGFDRDLAYYRDNPEEFLAQWGSWILTKNVFENADITSFLQRRSRASVKANALWKQTLFHIAHEVENIVGGLEKIDTDVYQGIMDITENMFGLSSSVTSEIIVENRNQRLGLITTFDTPITESELDTLRQLHRKQTIGTINPVEKDMLNTLETKYSQLRSVRMSHVEHNNLQEERISRGLAREELDQRHEKEVIATFIDRIIESAGKRSIARGTFGGLSHTAAVSIFGEQATNWITKRRYFVSNFGLTGSQFTYDNPERAITALMHIIGDTLSHHTGQYVLTAGAKGIRENRNYTKQWVESVAVSINDLRLMSNTDEEYNTLLAYAVRKAVGMSVTAPSVNPDLLKKANEVANAVRTNATNFKVFVFGEDEKYYDDIPVAFDILQLGISAEAQNKEVTEIQQRNREEFLQAIKQQIKENVIKNGAVNGAILYASGILPRINSTYREEGEVNNLITQLTTIKGKGFTFDLIKQLVINDLVASGISASIASAKVDAAFNDLNSLRSTNSDIGQRTHKAIIKLYQKMESFGNVDSALSSLGIVDTAVTGTGLISAFKEQLRLAINNPDPADPSSEIILYKTGDNSYPPGVSVSWEKDSPFTLNYDSKLSLLDLVAYNFIGRFGNKPKYLRKTSLVNMNNFYRNPKLSKFVSNRMHIALSDIERSLGFRAQSRRLIEETTGIRNLDIYDIITFMRRHANDIVLNPDEKMLQTGIANFLKALDEIEEKLRIEQGFVSSENGDDANAFLTKIALRYGPEITKMAYGGNLNAASLIVEGTLGAIITGMYGGNPLEFATDLFGGVLGGLFTNTFMPTTSRLQQRGLAINVMQGIEKTVADARAFNTLADLSYSENLTPMQKLRNYRRRIESSVYSSVSNSLTHQAQAIMVRALHNGDLEKVQKIFERDASVGIDPKESLKNQDDLERDLIKAKVKSINAHLAYELKMAGLFDERTLEIYRKLLTIVPSKNTKSGTLDFVAANKWAGEFNWSDTRAMVKLGIDFGKQDVYKTVASLYNATAAFRNIVLVDPNPWDTDTARSSLRVLMSFYKQYSNLFMAQHFIRRGQRMSTRNLAIVMIATTILDLIYNSLLLVALGVIPLAALNPFSEEFLFRTRTRETIMLIAARNPVFGTTANWTADIVNEYLNYQAKEDKKTSVPNRFQSNKKAVNAALDSIGPAFVPLQAFKTLVSNPLTTAMTLLNTKGNLNEQETYDMTRGTINSVSRLLPVIGELLPRMYFDSLLGPRPQYNPVRGVGAPAMSRPTTSRQPSKPSKPTKDNSLRAIDVPEEFKRK